jgi:hypothetical protein
MARIEAVKGKNREIPTIIGAGITEKWYFSHLKSLFNLKIKVRPRYFGDEAISALDKRIKKVLDEEGEAIVIFDADVSTWNAVEKKRLEKLKEKYAKNKRVTLCDSLPSIEYWFLLHYINTNRHFGTSKAVMKELVKYIVDFDKTENFLGNEKWVADMCSEDKKQLRDATLRAQSFGTEGESYTNVWKAIEKIGIAVPA